MQAATGAGSHKAEVVAGLAELDGEAFEGSGIAHMGVGVGEGENRIEDAVQSALNSPLLETSISGAKSILLYVSGGYDMGMLDINTIAEKVQTEADPDANIIFGAAISEEMNEKISVTIIATDFGNVKAAQTMGVDSSYTTPQETISATMGPRVTVDGMDAFEADLNTLLNDKSSSVHPASEFDIPDFLK